MRIFSSSARILTRIHRHNNSLLAHTHILVCLNCLHPVSSAHVASPLSLPAFPRLQGALPLAELAYAAFRKLFQCCSRKSEEELLPVYHTINDAKTRPHEVYTCLPCLRLGRLMYSRWPSCPPPTPTPTPAALSFETGSSMRVVAVMVADFGGCRDGVLWWCWSDHCSSASPPFRCPLSSPLPFFVAVQWQWCCWRCVSVWASWTAGQ